MVPGPGNTVPSTVEISAAPHAVGDDLVEHLAAGELFVNVGRIDVAGDRGKQDNVVAGEGAGDRGMIPHLDLVVDVVLDVVHGHLRCGGGDSFAAAATVELASFTHLIQSYRWFRGAILPAL